MEACRRAAKEIEKVLDERPGSTRLALDLIEEARVLLRQFWGMERST